MIRLGFFLDGCAASLSGNRADEVKTIVVLTKFFLASRIFARRFSKKISFKHLLILATT
jgi:hypothetical protein